MGQSYRIRTELGVNKTINVQLDQDFEYLEILSLKIQQSEVYTRSCANYGVVVGRITANNGFGVPNARVSIFIPIEEVDESNPIITSIYPYTSPTDKNSDGYRYNLLPYEKSYSKHAATGTLPSSSDVLTDNIAVEIYDKYYKYTSKTNESGDYMIMGAPLGSQTVVMDVDLSDIGEFSLTPQDLIRMGLATEGQVAGNRFRTSTDLNSLPQIISLTKDIEVSPLWGDPAICQIAVSRLDFDLRDDANVDIQPTSVFMGSMFSTSDAYRLRANGRPKDDMGNLCSLTTSPGQILAIRQTIQQDSDGNPVLEVYELEQAGNIIDGSGTWLTELPMNLDYYITNEFGEKVLSYDPTVGVPTKAKYRFKVKWTQPNDLTLQTRRPYYLVPNVREYGWEDSNTDPSPTPKSQLINTPKRKQQQSSYYFGLAWSGYTDGFEGQQKIDRLNDVIDCNDTFYEFHFNRVYTVSSLIDQYKKGGGIFGPAPGKFIGIKEIDSFECQDTVNKFPVNDGFRNFDLLFFLFSIIFTVIQPIGIILLLIGHILIFLRNLVYSFLCWLSGVGIGGWINWYPFRDWNKYCGSVDSTIRLPMLTYPDCQACDCAQELTTNNRPSLPGYEDGPSYSGSLSYLSSPLEYYDGIVDVYYKEDGYALQWGPVVSTAISGVGGGNNASDPYYKLPISTTIDFGQDPWFVLSYDLPIGERINIFNQRKSYFENTNKIKVTFAKNNNIGKSHYDNTLTVLSQLSYSPGQLLTFINVSASTDINYTYTANTVNGINQGISGETYNGSGQTTVNVSYAISQTENIATPVVYNLPYGSDNTQYNYPSDIEYYQVITAITVSDAAKIWNSGTTESFGNILGSETQVNFYRKDFFSYFSPNLQVMIPAINYFRDYETQYILILQRGVDPYSPLYDNEYSLGTLFGSSQDDPNFIVSGRTRINIPIQKLNSTSTSVQLYDQDNMFYKSYFFKPGTTINSVPGQSYTGFTTTSTAYYGSLDADTSPLPDSVTLVNPSIKLSTTGTARRVIQSLASFNDSGVACGDPLLSTKLLYTPKRFLTPAAGIRLFNSYDKDTNIFFNPFNGMDKWWKMNWEGSLYGIKVNSNGVIIEVILCSSLSISTVISKNSNGFWDVNVSGSKYDNSEDVSGIGVMTCVNQRNRKVKNQNEFGYSYYSTIFASSTTNDLIPMTISDSEKIVMRTDRLPSSDVLDGSSWGGNPALLQQNNNFQLYTIVDAGNDGIITSPAFTTGAQTVTQDLEGYGELTVNVLESFDCQNMVGLDCYQGFGNDFGVNQECVTSDAVEGGCYMFLRRPIDDLTKDIGNFAEWGYRFRFFYGLCRGVLSQSFMNNWINGSLFAFPIQVNTYYDSKNKAEYPNFCSDVAYYNKDSNNFYYRSSPWNDNENKFIGKRTGNPGGINDVNLLFPTTIINLGMKDYIYSEITFDPSTKGYIIPNIDSTSYADTSDLVNLFVISRITDEGFLSQLIPLGDNSIEQLFSRPKSHIDGDLAQLMSINSEIGNVNFSPEYYEIRFGGTNNPANILGTKKLPVMAVWFSSTTQDLQTKDYLTPGRINFRGANNVGYYPYPYGIKSQLVPFYQWGLDSNGTTIFGTQKNDWLTRPSEIIQNNYQSLDRSVLDTKYYLNGTTSSNDLTARGYIFSVDGDVVNYPTTGGKYTSTPKTSNEFLVGAPFQFYFGVAKGQSALDRFKIKYSVDE
jgi:hypothetical protein